jgi:glycosyltransferase involved in cell wall biosynthesis
VRSLAHIVDTCPEDTQVTVVTRDRDLGDDAPYPDLSGRWCARGRHRVYYLNIRSLRQWLRLLAEVRRDRFELLYANSVWSPMFTVVPIVATSLGLLRADRVLLAPRGEFSAGALSLKSRKKRWALRLWGPVLRRGHVTWHASSSREAADVRAALPWAKVQVVGDQVTLRSEALQPPDPHEGALRMVFLSRISAMKNLAGLLAALTRVRGPVQLDLYGPIEDRTYWSQCLLLAGQAPANVTITYRGEVRPDEVVRTFHQYDAFCLPTLGENFGHVIAESLAASCPVICSDHTPWSATLADGGGAVVSDLAPESLAAALQEWMDLSPVERHARRQAAGRAYQRWQRSVNGHNVLDVLRAEQPQEAGDGRRRVALVTQGFELGGGVPQVARWLRDGLEATGDYVVDHHDVATSRNDELSRRLTAPRTWFKRSLRGTTAPGSGPVRWGANAVEFEPMRYRPRTELTNVLNEYQLVQVVAGGPALARLTEHVGPPVVLQVATLVAWERASQLAETPGPLRMWRTVMTRIVQRVDRRALAGVDAILATNRELRDALQPATAAPVVVAALGVDVDRYFPNPEGLQQAGPILSVCRLGDPRKGLARMVRAYGLLVREFPDAPRLVLAGKGSPLATTRETIERLGLSGRVSIQTDVDFDALPLLYRSASLFVQASFEEGFGLSVAEAMASGLPVVCTDTAGTRETVQDHETGWVVPQQPLEVVETALAAAMAAALGVEGVTRGANGRARCVAHFAADVTMRRVTSVYDGLLGRGPDRSPPHDSASERFIHPGTIADGRLRQPGVDGRQQA